MKLSTDRILTTHVGSLPRSQAVVDLLFKKEQGETYDPMEFDRVVAHAVSETVRRQVEIGIDCVSDGETSKIGYATYIKDRLTGFSGDNPRQIALDLQPYPDFRARMATFAPAAFAMLVTPIWKKTLRIFDPPYNSITPTIRF
jgi:5-methyltetrahydropteroyltriglutamate--homocysteine methyltransferase